MNEDNIQSALLGGEENRSKLFYSISEVAAHFGVNESLLRFWEKEFDIINPRKSLKGTRRFYSKEDIENIGLVYYLVKEKKLTLSGAKKQLKENREGVVHNHEIIKRLKVIRAELIAIQRELE